MVFNALSHTIRRQIVVKIGNQGAVSYTDLTELGLEPGTLYFHLDILSKSDDPLVMRTGKKLYSLTELGQSAYELIMQGEDQIDHLSTAKERRRSLLSFLLDGLAMKPIVRRIQADPWRFFFETLIFLGLYGYLAFEVGLLPVFLFFLQISIDPGLAIMASLGSWIATYLLVELLSVPILRKRGFSRGLFASVPMAFVPHLLVEALWFANPTVEVLQGWPLTILLTGLIWWSTYILTIALSHAKGVRVSRAAIVTLIVTNLNLLLLVILSSSISP
ncbi:MAG: hypothetical protein ACFE7R_00620 [Candidatus Hodarchaeota archaeon]